MAFPWPWTKPPQGNKPLAGSAPAGGAQPVVNVLGSPYGGQWSYFLPGGLGYTWGKQLGSGYGWTPHTYSVRELSVLEVERRKRESYRPWTWRTFGKDVFAAAVGFGFGFSGTYGTTRIIFSPMKSGFTRVSIAIIASGMSAYALAGLADKLPLTFSLGAGAGIVMGALLGLPHLTQTQKAAIDDAGAIADIYNPISSLKRTTDFYGSGISHLSEGAGMAARGARAVWKWIRGPTHWNLM